MKTFLLSLCLILAMQQAKAVDASLLVAIIDCESSGRHDIWGDQGMSYGIAQIQYATFCRLRKKAKLNHFHWKNPVHQMKLLIWSIENGYGNEWTCYRKLTKPPMDSLYLNN